jgi:hypothetical protein
MEALIKTEERVYIYDDFKTKTAQNFFLILGKQKYQSDIFQAILLLFGNFRHWLIDLFRKYLLCFCVSTFTEERDGVEYFHYYRAQLMQGTSPELLLDHFRTENILVDLRLHDKGTMARNHGTGFRTYEDKLPLLFNNIKDL